MPAADRPRDRPAIPRPVSRGHVASFLSPLVAISGSYNPLMIACLFDIDGTLLASGGAGKAALESALTGEFNVELRTQIPYAGRTDRAIIRDLLSEHDLPDTSENLRTLLAGYLRRLPDSLRQHDGRVLP